MKNKMKLSTLAKALVNEEFVFFYQPVVSLFSGKISGAESLIRWIKPDGTIILPGEFIPLAEETGFITEITQHMLPKVIEDIVTLNRIDDSLQVSFNVSAKDFADDEFLDTLFACTTGKLTRPGNLGLEITETAFFPCDENTLQVLRKIDAHGISIFLDDFSAGYTTFSTLTQLPLTAIKVAMGVTQRASQSRMDFRLFRHLASLVHQLDLYIIAEGVEDEETHAMMQSVGCTHTQGYFYGRPMPLADFIELVNQKPVFSEYPFGLEYLAQFDHIDFRRDVIRASLMIYTHADPEIRKRALARLPELGHRECLFGKWYEKVGALNEGNPGYVQIGLEHKKFHDSANALLDKAQTGESWPEIQKMIVEFSNQSKIIMDLIQNLEIQQLKSHFLP